MFMFILLFRMSFLIYFSQSNNISISYIPTCIILVVMAGCVQSMSSELCHKSYCVIY